MFLLCGPPRPNRPDNEAQFSVPDGSFLLYEGMAKGYGRRSVYMSSEKSIIHQHGEFQMQLDRVATEVEVAKEF